MNFEWADGFHPPKGVTAEDVKKALDKLKEPCPEQLLEASRKSNHVLHDDLWAEGDQVWAARARLERCRKIIASIQEAVIVGGREIKIRAIEFVRPNGEGRWIGTDQIRDDFSLLQAYLREIQRLQDQASAKMLRFGELMKEYEQSKTK